MVKLSVEAGLLFRKTLHGGTVMLRRSAAVCVACHGHLGAHLGGHKPACGR